jgi:hypothetical protein
MITKQFRKELEQLINRHSLENGSDTPDFMLAGYLVDCLAAFDKAVTQRTRWYTPKEEVSYEMPNKESE